jgi:filamentous hemagglutinin
VSIAVGGISLGAATVTYGSLTLSASSGRFTKDYELYERFSSSSSGGSGNSEKPKSPQIADDKYLRRKGIDPHKLKYDFFGKNAEVKLYDIYYDKTDGQLWIKRKTSDVFISTGEYIK